MEYTLQVPETMSAALGLSDGEHRKMGAKYHPAVTGPEETWQGKSWTDMPGTENDVKKLNFFLFRRGLYEMPGRRDIRKIMGGKRRRA